MSVFREVLLSYITQVYHHPLLKAPPHAVGTSSFLTDGSCRARGEERQEGSGSAGQAAWAQDRGARPPAGGRRRHSGPARGCFSM